MEFLKTDANKLINIKCITWVKLMDECVQICVKSNGCSADFDTTHKICKTINPRSFDYVMKLNKENN